MSPELQNRGYQWPHKKDLCPPKMFFKEKIKHKYRYTLFNTLREEYSVNSFIIVVFKKIFFSTFGQKILSKLITLFTDQSELSALQVGCAR